MKKTLKKIASTALIGFSLLGIGSSVVSAAAVFSYSDVQSSDYEHRATANGVSSGWKDPGVMATVAAFIGGGTAQCYWNCRG